MNQFVEKSKNNPRTLKDIDMNVEYYANESEKHNLKQAQSEIFQRSFYAEALEAMRQAN